VVESEKRPSLGRRRARRCCCLPLAAVVHPVSQTYHRGMSTRVAPLVVGSLVLALSCGQDEPDDRTVVELSDDEVAALCEAFHDRICEGMTMAQCTSACRATCREPGTAALLRQECDAPITVAQVEECANLVARQDERAFEICTMGGGCVFDVFDETCP
jgi:hypothetical protein